MTAADSNEGSPAPARRPRGRPYTNVTTGRSISMLGVGMVIGAVIGAGIALLVAPQSGSETRHGIARRANRLRSSGGPWKKLGRELRRAAQAKRKSLEMEAKRQEIEAKRARSGAASL